MNKDKHNKKEHLGYVLLSRICFFIHMWIDILYLIIRSDIQDRDTEINQVKRTLLTMIGFWKK